ncbi:transmembrane protein 68-like isoform X2 [Terrapene carolina triunguis]|uniref:Transmembrane protein 68-like n=1 Tax=Terrapene triunguis TaxID=2587831 RepID=A0A674JHC9_9SAUR|nr:transmembrane protein 68-like isoform X2 [Terrapene carolina triunguis]
MISKSESYTSGQESVTNSTWLIYILKEWIGMDYHYPNYMGSFLCVSLIILFFPHLLWFIICVFCNICLHIYKRKNGLDDDFSNKLWDNGRLMVSRIISMYGKLWHGYEVHGIEKIPEGPGLIVYYHGATSVDYHFFVCNLYIQTGRVSYSVVDRALRMIPGLQLYLKLLTAVYEGREQCVEILKKGNLLGVAPGGARESFFSDENYGVLWGNRKGFAQVAIDAKVPIIPLFTQNIRESCRSLGTTWFIRWLNGRFQLPVVPAYGGFPVKLRTYIGDPIPYDPNITVTELVEKTKIAIEALRDRHQKLPGNILRALSERFDKHQKDD